MTENAELHELDDLDRAAVGLLIQAVEMQPNHQAPELIDSVTKLMAFLEKQSIVSFLGAQIVFNSLDPATKANILRDAKRLAIQFAGDSNIHGSVEKLMARLRDRKKIAPRPSLFGTGKRN